MVAAVRGERLLNDEAAILGIVDVDVILVIDM